MATEAAEDGSAPRSVAGSGDAFPAVPLRVRACTWNMSGKTVAAEDDLAALLLGDALPPQTPSSPSAAAAAAAASAEAAPAAPGGGAGGAAAGEDAARARPPDVCAVALQETVELSMGNIFWATDEEEISAHIAFEDLVCRELQRSGQRYVKVSSVGMVGLLLMVYVREELADQVKVVDCDRVKTGVFHLAGNKGAVCLRFELAGVSLCFLDVHLHAGQECQAARNLDIDDILRCAFQAQGGFGATRAPKGKFGRASEFVASRHNLTVILGDFNFRLDLQEDEPLPDGPPLTWLQYDQLRKGLVDGLGDFREGEIEFNPTYKYQVGTDTFDSKRHPAWCDRVLYKAASADVVVRLRLYDCVHELRHTSDHRPVVAEFEVKHRPQLGLTKNASTASLRSWLHKSLSLLGAAGPDVSPRRGGASPPSGVLGAWHDHLVGGCCCGGTELVSAMRGLSRSGSPHSDSRRPERSPKPQLSVEFLTAVEHVAAEEPGRA